MSIRNLGPVEMFECTVCKQRYTGAREDAQTTTWMKSHRKKHWTDGKGYPEWEN